MAFVDEMEFDRLGVFPYSPEEGTPAAGMPDQIEDSVKEERRLELMELQQEIAFDMADRMKGKEMLVMIEGKVADENAYVGRTYSCLLYTSGFRSWRGRSMIILIIPPGSSL